MTKFFAIPDKFFALQACITLGEFIVLSVHARLNFTLFRVKSTKVYTLLFTKYPPPEYLAAPRFNQLDR